MIDTGFLDFATSGYYFCSILENPGYYSGDMMAVSAKCRKSTPRIGRAVFLCLLLLSFIVSSSAYAAGSASSFAAGPPQPCVSHVGSANADDSCPCPVRHHEALTCCCPAVAFCFATIDSEAAFRAMTAHAAALPDNYLLSVSSRPSKVFRPPKPAVWA